MNFTSLFALFFPDAFDQLAAKIVHQVAGSGKGGAAIAAIQQIAEPYIAQQVGIHLANGTTPATAPNQPLNLGTLNLGQFVPPSVEAGGQPE